MNISFFFKNFVLLFLLIFVLTPKVHGQLYNGLIIQHLNAKQGLSGTKIRSLFKDSEGYIWVGTNQGLNQYDGYSFRSFTFIPSDSTSLSGKSAYAITEDKQKNLWVGTSGNGLNLYDRETDQFIHFVHDPLDTTTISHNWITSLFVDSQGRLWIGTQNGLNLYEPETGKFRRYLTDLNKSTEPAQLRLSSLYDIKEDMHGNLWIATWIGLIVFNPDENFYYNYKQSEKPNSISTDSLQSLFIDENNIIWVGAYKGSFEKINPEYYNDTVMLNINHYPVGRNFKNGISDNRVNDIVSDDAGNLWIATEYGLNFFNPVKQTFEKYYRNPGKPHSLTSNIINTLYYDDNNMLWIGTNDNGLNLFDPNFKKFDDYFPSINQSRDVDKKFVKSIYQDNVGNYWIGTDYGILVYDKHQEQIGAYSSLPGNKFNLNIGGITGFFEDSLNNLWVSTWGGGIHKKGKNELHFDNIAKSENIFQKFSPSDNDIRIMKMHPDGNAWLGTSRGFLNRFNPYDKTFRHYFIFDRDSLRGVPVVSIAFQDKIIWAGAIENGGITKLDQETNNIQRFFSGKGKNQLPSNEIFSLFVDSQDELWIGTDVGLVKYNKKNEEFILISGQKRVPSESILNINEDREGNLWLSTPGSLIKYHPSDTTLVIYDETDGIYTSSTTSLLTKEGKLLFGGINGLNFFDPSGIFSNKKEPEIVFTDLQIKNQSVDINPDKSPLDKHINYTSEITLNWDQSFFSIYFAAMNFSHPEKNQYACKLEGFEDDWNYIGTRRYASYTNVPPGYYVFRVIASNNDGIWNETGRQLKINIKPPWWKTSGAYIAYIAIILISIYLITRIALMREQMKSELRLQQVEFEKKQALLEKEHEVDQMKIQFLTNIAHEFRTPLTLVISPVNDILSSMKISPEATGHLELVKKNAHRLLRLINQILDFSKVEAGFMKLEVAYGNFSKAIEYINQSFELRAKRRNINYICEISHKNAFGYFDLDKIEKILYNIISNSFKFTGDNDTIKIEVNYKISDGKIINSDDKIECEEALISVSDTGIGIPKEKLNMVFNRFFQAHSKETGTGIGLSLAKSLTRIHKGNIKVFSDEKQGTLFQIRIPLNKQIFPEDSIRDGQNEKDFYPSFFLQTEENNFPVNELNIALINQLPSMLIVEDEKDMQEYIKFIFKKDFTIYTANNGLEGLNKAKELIPDIVISDIMMPEMDGIELTKKLKSAKETSHVLVILLTAKITKDDKITGFETGADDYILKPFESDELRLKVNNIVETRKKFQKQFSNHPLKNLNKMVFNSTDKKIMEKLFELINENIENPNLDHKFLCENLGISRAQLYRKIKALTNQTAHDFIRNIRLNKAVELMLDRGLSVSEVMYKVGFQNHSYFSKCFKKKFGKPPSGYVKNNSDN